MDGTPFQVYLTEEDMRGLSKGYKTEKGSTEIHIPAFNIHHKTIGNGNGESRITTSAYGIRCYPDDFKITKNYSQDALKTVLLISLLIYMDSPK